MTNVAVGTTHFLDIGAYGTASANLSGNQNALYFAFGNAVNANVFVKFANDPEAVESWFALAQFTPTENDGMCIPTASNIRTLYDLQVGHQQYMFVMATAAVELHVTELV